MLAEFFQNSHGSLFTNLLSIIFAVGVSAIAYGLAIRLLRFFGRYLPFGYIAPLSKRLERPGRWLVLCLALGMAINWSSLPGEWKSELNLLLKPIVTGIVGWLVGSAIMAVSDGLRARYNWHGSSNNLASRRISTQLRVFRSTALFVVTVITVIAMAMSVPGLRTLGISLFASAGVAGLVIGMAAKSTLSNLIAGIQLALAQPMRLDDVVIIEGEWGRIEEITATYVVVAIWDQRRMVVPLTYFIEKPFQNWTHSSSEMLGTVFLYLDYTAPLDALREQLGRIVEETPLWDKRVAIIQMTECKDQTIELRVLVSAADAASLFDLRCIVREKLMTYLRQHHAYSLPRRRQETIIEQMEPIAAAVENTARH